MKFISEFKVYTTNAWYVYSDFVAKYLDLINNDGEKRKVYYESGLVVTGEKLKSGTIKILIKEKKGN